MLLEVGESGCCQTLMKGLGGQINESNAEKVGWASLW